MEHFRASNESLLENQRRLEGLSHAEHAEELQRSLNLLFEN